MVSVRKKKPTSGCGAAAATSPFPSSSSSASSSCSRIVPSWPPSHKKKKRARSGVGDAAVVVPAAKGSSIYRGVSRHRASGKYEAHLWDGHCLIPAHSKKGKQVYLGTFDTEEAAARAYDLAALKYWGSDHDGPLNFPVDTYRQECETMLRVTREEYLAKLKRESSSFTRGASKYRGVARHHVNGRWEARIGHPSVKRYLYLGTYVSEEDAARAYDHAAIRLRGLAAVTNFGIGCYDVSHLVLVQPPLCKVDPDPAEPEPKPVAPPLLQPKVEPSDDADADDGVEDRVVAEVLQALGMDRAEFDSRYPPRRQAWWPPSSDDDDVRDLPADVGFEEDIESVEFGAPQGDAAAISCAAATISSMAVIDRWT